MSATREHGIIDALNAAGVSAVTDTAYQVGGPRGGGSRSGVADSTLTPAATAAYRRAEGSHTAHARQRGHCERANAELKSWKVLRKIRSSPSRGTVLVQAVQTLMIIG